MIKSMYKKILTITFLAVLFFTIICVNNFCWAISDVTNSIFWNTWQPTIQDGSALTEKIEPILGAIKVVGIVVSVATLVFIGIRFMYGSVEEKAKYKEQLIPWIIGATMVFAITTIPSIIYDLTSDAVETVGVEESNGGTKADYLRGFDEGVLEIATYNAFYREADFAEYLTKQKENIISAHNINNNMYYKGIVDGLEEVIARVNVNLYSFSSYVDGYKEAIYYINNKIVTQKNIQDAIKEANTKWMNSSGNDKIKFFAKKNRLILQRDAWSE